MKKLMHIILILSLLLLPGFNPAKAQEARDVNASAKITSALAYQIDLKREAAVPASAEKALKTLDALGSNTADLQSQRVFIYFKSRPDSKQLSELLGMGITPYPDSWIPPVGIHPYGFITARTSISSIGALAERPYTVKIDTAERLFKPANDLAAQKIHSDNLWSSGYDGTGVKVAVLDSGLELGHPDIPASVAYADYAYYPTVDYTISNTVTGHGTHVTGSVLGRGVATGSSGKYKGMAPGASLIFLKIGKDTTGGASSDAMVNAIKDAKDFYGADIINISYGGWDDFMDGTDPVNQAVEYVFNKGTAVFISAGNEANDDWHYSGTVNGNSSTGFIQVNYAGASVNNLRLRFNLVWFDGLGTHNSLKLQYFDSSSNLLTSTGAYLQEESPRGTEHQQSYDSPYLPSSPVSGSRYLKVVNNSPTAQQFHIYFNGVILSGGPIEFQNPDPNYTIGSPANADGAITVGAYVTRSSWTNYKNVGPYTYGETVNTLATFSSRGPRVDTGAPPKPDIIAPGSTIISLRDRNVYLLNSSKDPQIIDNDGATLDGTGPADYYALQGTSMSSPVAAGAAAQLLQARPSLKGNPAKLRTILQRTASNNGVYYSSTGYGMLNILAALSYDDTAPPVPVLSSPATSAVIYSTVSPTFTWSSVTDVDNASPPILYDLRIASAASMATSALIISKTNLATNNYTLTGAESLASGTWYWQVRARDSSTTSPTWNYSAWSSPAWSFSAQSTVVATATWQTGWVMWSYPFVPDTSTNSGQLGDDVAPLFVYHYNAGTGVYDITTVATPGWGYWTKVSGSTPVDMSGQPVASATFDVALGSSWNQIGSPYYVTIAWSSVQFIKDGVTKSLAQASTDGWVSQWIYNYDTTGGVYQTKGPDNGGVLAPMVGYWMKASMPNVTLRITRP